MEQMYSTYENLEVTFSFENRFLRSIEARSQECRVFNLPQLLLFAKTVIPLDALTQEANERVVQFQAQHNQTQNPDVLIMDMMLTSFLRWFRFSFFTWVDNPECQNCRGTTKFSHTSNDSRFPNTDHVEMHKCDICKEYTPFPRYNKLDILLMTRKGRSVESAKLFTLMCYALGWDARCVVDEGNHIWTEVFFEPLNIWLHCDPCENTLNTPLMYEHGWNKEITYVMAYSRDDIEDVTRRYTSNYKAVLTRRKNCNEMELVDAIKKLRRDRQKEVSSERKFELIKRSKYELKQLAVEKYPIFEECKGRTSGIKFRSMNDEDYDVNKHFVWIFSDTTTKNKVTIRYSTSQNTYQYLVDGVIKKEVYGWFNAVYSHKNIIRNEETDQKQVYLLSNDKTRTAHIEWDFKLTIPNKVFDHLDVIFTNNTFNNGRFMAYFTGTDVNLSITEETRFSITGLKSLTICTFLWHQQDVQLFRQGTEATDFPFVVELTLKDEQEETSSVNN